MKTVLAPNAPWPKFEPKMPKKRAKPSEVDAKFEQWLKENKDGITRRR
jgi:hypothetical protein